MSGSRGRYRTRPGEGGDVVVEDAATGRVSGRYAMTGPADGDGIERYCATGFHDPGARARFEGPMIEIGRFCVEAGLDDPDVLRVAWGVLSDHVDRRGIDVLFGCATLAGTDAAPYRDAFARLRERHPLPDSLLTRVRSHAGFPLARRLAWPDLDTALRGIPPLPVFTRLQRRAASPSTAPLRRGKA